MDSGRLPNAVRDGALQHMGQRRFQVTDGSVGNARFAFDVSGREESAPRNYVTNSGSVLRLLLAVTTARQPPDSRLPASAEGSLKVRIRPLPSVGKEEEQSCRYGLYSRPALPIIYHFNS